MSIAFTCPGCGKYLETDESTAGAEASCPDCATDFIIPGAPEPTPAQQPGKTCKSCGAVSANPQALICMQCGNPLSGKPLKKSKGGAGKAAGKIGVAVFVGATAAVLSAILWAVIVIKSGWEIGYVAWAIGLLVGLALRMTTSERSPRIGVAAVLLAGGALVLGKFIIVEYHLQQAEKMEIIEAFNGGLHPERVSTLYLAVQSVARESAENMSQDFENSDFPDFSDIIEQGENFAKEYERKIEAKVREYDKLPAEQLLKHQEEALDVLLELRYSGELMSERGEAVFENWEQFQIDVKEGFAKLTRQEKDELARKIYSAYQETQGEIQNYKSELRKEAFKESFSHWDLLWFAFAIGSAWGLTTKEEIFNKS